MAQEKERGSRVDFENFKNGLLFIKDAIEQERGVLDFGPKGINFHYESNMSPDELEKEYNLQRENISEITEEVLEITDIVLSGRKNNIISNLKNQKSDLLQTFKERCNLVEKEFIDLSLTRRYFLQKNYKTALLDKFDWDIIVKRIEQDGKNIDFPSVIVRLRIKKEFTENPPVPKTETMVFESNIDEIDDLINNLEEIKSDLEDEEERLKR